MEPVNLKIGAFNFECRISGDPQNEPVLLLHGFPESSIMYEALMKTLNSEGFYCVAPNLRGYSKGARPHGRKNYTIEKLALDVLDIAGNLGIESFHLVAHDWGAAVGWKVVADNPGLIKSWTAMSVPHLQSFFRSVAIDQDQRERSKYIRQFQIPFIPEMKMRAKNFAALRKLWDQQSPAEVEDYLRILRQKGALTATLNYYRANYRLTKLATKQSIMGDIPTPTMFIWGKNDFAIGPTAVMDGHKYMTGPYEFIEKDAGHWILDEIYHELEPIIVGHIKKYIS